MFLNTLHPNPAGLWQVGKLIAVFGQRLTKRAIGFLWWHRDAYVLEARMGYSPIS